MRIVYFHQHFSTPKGSLGTRSYEMAKALIKRGHQVLMVCGSYKGGHTGLESDFHKGYRSGVVEGIEVIEFDLSYSNSDGLFKRFCAFFVFALRSIKIAMFEKYDVIFCTSTPLTASVPGIVARWFRRKVFVFEVRDLWPEAPKAMGVLNAPFLFWLMSVLEKVSYFSANKIIGLSPGIVQGIVNKGVPEELVRMIPNGCDLNLFNPSIKTWMIDEVVPGDFVAIFSGAHGLANGLHSVIDAAVILKNRGRCDIKIVLIGQGKTKSELVERARELRLSNVIFVDPVSKFDLAGLMAGANLGLQVLANVPAFYYGTSPNKFFDYIAAGLPVLTNYPGWVADIVSESDCGYVVPPDNPIAFADAIVDAADHPDQLIEMGNRARRLAENKFNRASLGEEFSDWVTGITVSRGG